MADRKSNAGSRPTVRRKERAEPEAKKDENPVKEAEVSNTETEMENGAGAGAAAASTNGEKPEPMELPPFEIIKGNRIDPFFFKFQFKNVEYSSGRNKTFLCYLVDQGPGPEGLLRGYIEDEHTGFHAEEAFFQQVLPNCDPACKYTVTWYMSSSPCAPCAGKLAEILQSRKNVKLSIFSARLFEWEEPEIQAGLKMLAAAGCKLRMMKPLDFTYTWDTFVENDDQQFTLWEDCQENYEYYQEKLADILQ